jgi:hypothetical protein
MHSWTRTQRWNGSSKNILNSVKVEDSLVGNILLDLRNDFWMEAYRTAMRSRIIEDGIYHLPTDIDVVYLYCGATL